ncbi:protein angel homolog 2-like isoform X2 [Pecten maximus]|nr:protein angel homolog 2-like isoform X2 [Pecten maximus]
MDVIKDPNGPRLDDTSTTKSQKRRYSSGSSSSTSQQACTSEVIKDQMRHDDPAIIDLTFDDQTIIDLTVTSSNLETNTPNLKHRDLEKSAVKQDNSMGPLFSRLKESKHFQRESPSGFPEQLERFSEHENRTSQCSLNPPSKKHKTDEQNIIPELAKENDVEARPYKSQRKWEWTSIGRQCLFENRRCSGTDFTVMSYNVLAQNLLHDNMYLYLNSEEKHLQWDYRKHILLREIKEHLPDILCLQEVNLEHYKSFFIPELAELGYKGEFQKRTGNDKFDGCATFYNTNRFKMVKCWHLCYHRQYRILDRDNVAVILKLQPITKQKHSPEICVANTHLLFNPRRGDVKFAQMVLLLAEIDKLTSTLTSDGQTSHIPTIACGDFNLVPKSDLYKFLVEGYIHFEGLLANTLSGQRGGRRGRDTYLDSNFLPSELNISKYCTYSKDSQLDLSPSNQKSQDCSQNEMFSCSSQLVPSSMQRSTSEMGQGSGCLWHNLKLVSSYKHRIERLGKSAQEVTTYHGHDSAIVDYIFYNITDRDAKKGKLALLGRWGLLSEKELCQIGTFPCKNHPSDHLPLISRFLLE